MRGLVALLLAVLLCGSTAADGRPRRRRSTPRLRKGAVELCLSRAAVSPPLKLMVALTVNRRGRVTSAGLAQGSLPAAATEACVLAEFRRLRFPRRHAHAVVVPFLYVSAGPPS
jgi:hypothetical protein